MMLFFMGVIVPLVVDKTTNPNTVTYTILIAFTIALSVGAFVSGGLLGFALIENKDEKTILNIAVTPIKVEGYTMFKIIYTYVLSIIGNMIIVGGLKLIASNEYVINGISLFDNLSFLKIFIFCLVSGLLVPTIALIIASIAKNKIEGFAFIKGGGFIIMLPVLTVLDFFKDVKQYLLGFAFNFWPIKAMLNEATNSHQKSNLNYYLYMLIGSIYSIIIFIVCLRMFIRKLNLN
jgi:fluoroquinolone transport system permease protein